jgi:hypothetical protein
MGAATDTIVLFILLLLMIGALPRWPHSANWGYYPSGGLAAAMVIVHAIILTQRF